MSSIRSGLLQVVAVALLLGTSFPHVFGNEHVATYRTLEKFCAECHAADVAEGGFDLTALREPRGVLINRRVTQRVIAQIESGSMPPDDPRPLKQEAALITKWLRSTLAGADWESLRAPVELLPSRMTRQEYINSVRDLLGVSVDVSDLLSEDSVGANGFNNDRASLAMTESHLQQYLEAANRAVTAVIDATGVPEHFHVEAEDARHVTISNVKNAATLPDGTAGFEYQHHRGIKYQQVSKTIEFPRTGTYRFEIRAKVKGKGKQGGVWIALDSVGDHRRDATLLVDKNDFEIYSTEIFVTAGHHEVILGSDFNAVPWLPPVPELPQRKLPPNRDQVIDEFYQRQNIEPVTWREIEALPGFSAPKDMKAVMDIVDELNRVLLDESVRIFELFRLYEDHQFLPVNQPKGLRGWATKGEAQLAKLIGVEPSSLHALWTSHEPTTHKKNELNSQALLRRWKAINSDRQQHVGNVFVDWFKVSGPVAYDARKVTDLTGNLNLNTEAISVGDGKTVIRTLLNQWLPRAFRRPIDESDLRPLLGVYARERDAGASHGVASRRTLVAGLMSPHFLYVGATSPEPSGGTKDRQESVAEVPLSPHQLAARLSYLFWMTTPDEILIKTVENLDRTDSVAFDSLVNAMLNDERSKQFSRDFTSQWLGLGAIGSEKTPDSELFREFSWQLAEDMREEVAMMFRNHVLNDRSLLELLDGKETFLNERLARLYGIDSVHGVQMRPHSMVSTGRAGLLGTAAVLTATSLPARTSPVQRGKFVIETLLGEDLPPPPEDAGVLDEDAGQSVSTTLRDQLAAHRDNPSCIGCHQRIDPIGFALEKFDFVGRRRERTPAGPINDLGRLPDGQEVAGLPALTQYLRVQRGDAFVDNLTRRLLAYSLGRSLDYRDEADVRLIIEAVQRDNCSAQTLVHEVVRSRAFQMRKQ